jgi:hypothetical protein
VTKSDGTVRSISLHSILNSFSGLVGLTIWYRVDSEGFRTGAENFTGKSTDSLREASRLISELTHPACMLKLVVATSDGERDGLRRIANLAGQRWSLQLRQQLISDYDINENNPILVKLPGKYTYFVLNCA